MTKKKIVIGCGIALIALVAVIVSLILIRGAGESYRVIKVFSLDGSADVVRENMGTLEAYEGMVLQSGDKLYVDADSTMVLLMDDDKYGYVESNSILTVVAEGTERTSKTVIQLEQGAITCHVDAKLNDSSSYEVHTQNSVMAVRGTVFRVEYYQAGKLAAVDSNVPESVIEEYKSGALTEGYTRVSVFEGKVSATLLNADGTTGDEIILEPGKECWIGSGSANSFFVLDNCDIDLNTLPPQAVDALLKISGNGASLYVKDDELIVIQQTETEAFYNVYFYADGVLFGRQEVNNGEKAQVPTLQPAEQGYWNHDFSMPIGEHTEIYWWTNK